MRFKILKFIWKIMIHVKTYCGYYISEVILDK